MRRLLISLLLALASVASMAAPAKPSTTPQVLNLKDADIQALITTVSDITGKNFIVGPNVQGRVTVVSAKPMTADEIYQVFLSVLAVHGYAALPAADGTIKIVSEASARSDGAVGIGASQAVGDPLVTEVVPVHYVPAAELATILQQFVPQGGRVVAHGPSNTLILSDRASVVRRLRGIIQRVDTASDAQVEVIPLQHADAAELARTLTRLDGQSEAATPGGVKVLADTRTNSILLSGDKSRRLRLRTLITHLDTPLDSGGATQVVYLNYANAKELVPILENVVRNLSGTPGATAPATGAAAAATGGNTPASIQADPNTNALIITATPAVFRSLQSVIRQLDIRRAQVLIEAVIAEVGLTTAKEIGVQWQMPFKTNADGSLDNSVVGGTNFNDSSGAGNILNLYTNPLALGGGLNLGYLNGSITLPGSDTPILQIGALIRALQGDGNSNLLSTPNVVTLDNHEAVFKVAQEVPFKTGQYTSTSSGGSNLPNNPFQTIERKDVGLTLTVTPHINEGDTVRLDIHQEVSSLAPSVAGAVDLITNKREIKTSVMVADDSILVLGGLISNTVSDSVRKVPLLGDIPLLGNLFRSRSGKRDKQDLMVFLHPKILRDAATEQAVSSEKYNYIRTEQLKMREDDALLTPRDKRPLLPAMHDFLANPGLPPAEPAH
ncbi:MAG TPA: type II secretion system secretin GspD [Rhodanobacteraceae bacterium]|nr:type II secretion system secretin GspD [Rhodanobacteraceae bacterium]